MTTLTGSRSKRPDIHVDVVIIHCRLDESFYCLHKLSFVLRQGCEVLSHMRRRHRGRDTNDHSETRFCCSRSVSPDGLLQTPRTILQYRTAGVPEHRKNIHREDSSSSFPPAILQFDIEHKEPAPYPTSARRERKSRARGSFSLMIVHSVSCVKGVKSEK